MNENVNELPHDLLAEKSLIGCLLIDGESYHEISDTGLSKDDFFSPKFSMIFEIIFDLMQDTQPVDFVTVCSKLKDLGQLDKVGGQSFVLNIVEDQASSANVNFYATTIKEKSTLRKIVKMAMTIANDGRGNVASIDDFVAGVETGLFKLTQESRPGKLQNIKNYIKANLRELERTDRNAGELSGLSTGFDQLDQKLLGMQAGQLLIVAARPAMGKSAFALNAAVNSCKVSGLPAALFSLEMMGNELSMRLLSSEAKVDSMRIRSKSFGHDDLINLGHAAKVLSNTPIYINDESDISLSDVKSQCRKIKSEHGLGMIVIDYLQLMKGSSGLPREQQISEISRGLKGLAKELECPIMALAQLNRGTEHRVDKRPMLADLRESGAIEQDADVVMMLYRDEVYNENTQDKGVAELIIVKNRAGETGTVKLAWKGCFTLFSNLQFSDDHQESRHY